jgi:PTH1 family peptidyl-tRNA hydrolase
MPSHFPRGLVSRIASLANKKEDRVSSLDLLVVGLGNPGREHESDRHNAGWLVLDELGRRLDAPWRGKFSGRLAEVRLDGLRLALLKPETYMNLVGGSVGAAARYFKVDPERLLVVHDDVDLAPGRLQARAGGGLAGHNGLRSLAQALGTQDFLRLRIGVGRPARGDPRSVADYVLSSFEPEEDIEALVPRAADAVETIARDGLEAAQQRFN